MASTYPATLDAFDNPAPTDSTLTESHSAQHSDINDAIENVQAELGTDPAGFAATLADRLGYYVETVYWPGSGGVGSWPSRPTGAEMVFWVVNNGDALAPHPSSPSTGDKFFPAPDADSLVYDAGSGSWIVDADITLGAGLVKITSGTTVPNSNVTAPPGSTYIHYDAVLGDLEYFKSTGTGDTGWVPTGNCDTGIRDLSGETLDNGFTVEYSIYTLRRVGNWVSLALNTGAGSATANIVDRLPDGFRPAAQVEITGTKSTNDGRLITIEVDGDIVIWDYAIGGNFYFSAVFITDDALPLSYPGV